MTEPAAPAAPAPLERCPVCAEPLAARRTVACTSCATRHHLECWQFSRGCAAFGCGGVAAQDRAPALVDPSEPFVLHDWSAARAEPFWWATVTCVPLAVLLGALGAPAAAAGAPLVLVLLAFAWVATRRFLLRPELSVDPSTRAVARGWRLLGRPFGVPDPAFVPPGAAAGVRLHCTTLLRIPVERLWLDLADGRSRLVYDTFTFCPWYRLGPVEVRELAERVARAVGAPLRRYEAERPTPEAELPASAPALPDSPAQKGAPLPEDRAPFAMDVSADLARVVGCLAVLSPTLALLAADLLGRGDLAPSRTLLLAGTALGLAVLSFALVVDHVVRLRLDFDPTAGTARRSLVVLGRTLWRWRDPWLRAEDLLEVHLHRSSLMGYPSEQLRLALRDGREKLLYRYDPFWDYLSCVLAPTLPSDRVTALAERLARFGRCTVRCLEGSSSPPPAELPRPPDAPGPRKELTP